MLIISVIKHLTRRVARLASVFKRALGNRVAVHFGVGGTAALLSPYAMRRYVEQLEKYQQRSRIQREHTHSFAVTAAGTSVFAQKRKRCPANVVN